MNDVTGVYLKKGVPADTITFSIEKCDGTVITNQGDVGVFPNDPLAVGYIFDWQAILIAEGEGKYNIKADYTIASISDTITMGSYELKEYTRDNVRDSVRIYSEFNSYYLKDDIDFTNSNFRDTVRFNGFFGNREPETDINNLIDKGRKVNKVTRENLNRYTLMTDPVSIGMSRQLLDKHFVNEDLIKISDYNRFNHDFNIYDKEVVLVETPEITYIEMDRRANIKAVFGDKKMQDKSYYR